MVGNAGSVRHYFIEAFTPYGHCSLLSNLLKDMKYTYFLSGGPGTGKSTMIKLIGIELIDRGYDVDYVRSVREPDSVAGLFVPKQKLGLLDKNEFIIPESTIGYQSEITFDNFCNKSRRERLETRIEEHEKRLIEMERDIILQLQKDYKIKTPHKEMYIEEEADWMQSETGEAEDAPGLDEITSILSKVKKNSLFYHFLQGLYFDGWLNLAPRYIRDFDRICLEGEESGSVLRDILQEVRCLGQTVEIIVHPLKPFTIIGIVFPEKKLAVWKGNPGLMEEQGFMKKHSTELTVILERYKKTRIELKSINNDTVDFRGLDDLRSELISRILVNLKE